MSSVWSKARTNTPQIDCGLCGRSSCAAFSRAVIAGICSVDQCPILTLPQFAEQRTTLEQLTQQRPRPVLAPPRVEGGVTFTRPCVETESRFMAEVRVSNGVAPGEEMRFPLLDGTVLCSTMECLRSVFQEIKCSRELGYGRADTGELNITVLQDGRINMRRVESVERVKALSESIERTILGAVICNCCGDNLLWVLSASETDTDYLRHPVLKAGSSTVIDQSVARVPLTKELVLSAIGQDSTQLITDVDRSIKHITSRVERLQAEADRWMGNVPDMKQILCSTTELMRKDTIRGKETIVLKLQALVWALIGANTALDAVYVLMNRLSPESKDIVQKMLAKVSFGMLSTRRNPLWSAETVLCHAHLWRVSQAMQISAKFSTPSLI